MIGHRSEDLADPSQYGPVLSPLSDASKTDDNVRLVIYNGAKYSATGVGEHETPRKRSRMTRLSPEQSTLLQLRRRLTDAQDRLRKLKLLEKQQVEQQCLEQLIDKWRNVCEEVLIAIKKAFPDRRIRSKEILRGVSSNNDLLQLSSSSGEEDESLPLDADPDLD